MTRAQKLQAYLDRARAERFRPGEHDCALFVAGWVALASGTDHGEEWRGAYKTLADGKALLAERGCADHIELAASLLTELPPAMARTGDLAVVGGEALGIVSDERVFVLRLDGLGHVSRRLAERAFTV